MKRSCRARALPAAAKGVIRLDVLHASNAVYLPAAPDFPGTGVEGAHDEASMAIKERQQKSLRCFVIFGARF